MLSQADTFPYTAEFEITGISIINMDTVSAEFDIGTFPIVHISVPIGTTYDGDFQPFRTIDATGSNFQIELRG
jgi:hypothetical protein